MNIWLSLTPVLAATSLANSALSCPRGCDHPKNENECRLCYENGVREIMRGNGDSAVDRRLGTILQKGSQRTDESANYRPYEWSSNKCWIFVKGMDFEQCHNVGRAMFGYGRCYGFQAVSYYEKSTRCWTSFEPPNYRAPSNFNSYFSVPKSSFVPIIETLKSNRD